ncbi:MAG: DUF502 domain-containing protein, partial [Pseudomonadales bacterium]|nr:DUF502 domain-containing protein [Pseudomonadales bacterium]
MTRTFLRGLGVVLPLVVTVWVIVWLATGTEAMLHTLFLLVLPADYYLPGLGLLLGVSFIYLCGLLVGLLPIRNFWDYVESWLQRIPLFKTIYRAISDFTDFFSTPPAPGDSKVVSVDMGEGSRLIGFVTDHDPKLDRLIEDPIERIAVYLPMS